MTVCRAPLPAQGQSDTEMPGEGEGKRLVSPGRTLGPAPQQQLLAAFPLALPPPASHAGGDIDGVHALGQRALQVVQRIQALYLAAAPVHQLPEGVLLQQGLHVLEEEALTEQGQFWGVVDLWGRGRGETTT